MAENQAFSGGLNLDDIPVDVVRMTPVEGGNLCKLKSIKIITVEDKVTKDPVEAVEITFVNEKGAVHTHIIKKLEYAEDNVGDDKKIKLIIWNINFLKHLFGAYLPEGQSLPTGITWAKGGTMKKLVQDLGANCIPMAEMTELPVRLKLMYSESSNFVNIPLFPPFLSSPLREVDLIHDPSREFLKPQAKKPDAEKGTGASSGSSVSNKMSKWD